MLDIINSFFGQHQQLCKLMSILHQVLYFIYFQSANYFQSTTQLICCSTLVITGHLPCYPCYHKNIPCKAAITKFTSDTHCIQNIIFTKRFISFAVCSDTIAETEGKSFEDLRPQITGK